jgi:hypothetical protein
MNSKGQIGCVLAKYQEGTKDQVDLRKRKQT